MNSAQAPLTARPAWKALVAHHEQVRGLHLRRLFAVDPGRAARLAPPPVPGRAVVSLSGIASRADIERQAGAGISRFLVGESLVRDPDPAAALRRLRGVPERP